MKSPLPVPCTVTGRVLPYLSLFGTGDDIANGHPLTKGGRQLPIHLSSSIFRRFVCVEGCMVCCSVFSLSLDFIPTESAWLANPRQEEFKARPVNVNGVEYDIMTNATKLARRDHPVRDEPENLHKSCMFLGPVRNGNAGCTLWATGSPLACAAAYNMRVSETPYCVQITKQGLGRAWRYDPSPECRFETAPLEEMDIETNIYLIDRFTEWALYFNMSVAVDRTQQLAHRLREVLRTGLVPTQIIVL